MDSEPQPKMDPDQLLSLLIESLSNIDQNINNPDPLIQNLESLLDSHGSVLNELSLDPALIQAFNGRNETPHSGDIDITRSLVQTLTTRYIEEIVPIHHQGQAQLDPLTNFGELTFQKK